MVFPQTVLDAQVSLQLTADGPWTSITSFALQRDGTAPPIQITRGRPDESAQINPAVCNMQWNNADGRFSPRNPTGPYYGQLGRNTPVRVSVPDNQVYARFADDSVSSFIAADSAALQIVGNITVDVDMMPDDYTPTVLFCKWGSTANAWALLLNGDGTVSFQWFDGSATWVAKSDATIPLGRVAVRAGLNHNTGTVTFFTATNIGATFNQLGDPISPTGGAATAVGAGVGQSVRVGFTGTITGYAGYTGQFYEARIFNSAGTIVADPVFTAQSAGATSFADAQANTWVANTTAELSNRSYRFHGEASSLPQQWDVTGNDVWTPVSAAGLWRRLSQGQAQILSPMRRGILNLIGKTGGPNNADVTPVAYWPCEDVVGSNTLTSGLPSGTGLPMTFGNTTVALAADSTFNCSLPLPQINTSIWTGQVQLATFTDNAVRWILFEPASMANNSIILSMFTTGTVARMDAQYFTGGGLGVQGFNSAGASLFSTGSVAFGIDNVPVRMGIALRNTGGGNVEWRIEVIQANGKDVGAFTHGTITATVGRVVSCVVNPGGRVQGAAALGHIVVQRNWESLFDQDINIAVDGSLTGPLRAWTGEAAGNRFSRLCGENGIAPRVYGFPSDTVRMGPQQIDTLANVLQSCEDADQGMIYEPRQCLGLGYRTLASMTNQVAKVAFNYTAGQLGDGSGTLLSPTDDDQYTINDVTVTRNGGSSYEFQLNDGSAMSISPPPVGAGQYTNAVTQFLQDDAQLQDAAGWLVHRGTVNDERYPVLPLNLARTALASVFFTIQNTEIGDYVSIVNPPSWLPPFSIKQILAGVTEQIGGFHYHLGWQAIPETVYETGIYDDAVYGRADTDGSTLSAGITSGAVTFNVATTSATSPLWTTAGGDFPFNIIIGGEVMTVGSVTGASSPQSFTVTRSINGVVKAHLANEDVRLWPTPVYALT